MRPYNSAYRLQQIMKERNLRQVDILNMSKPYQKQLGIKLSKSHLSRYVSGASNPHQNSVYLLSKTLDVSEGWLMGYDVEKERVPDSERGSEKESKTKHSAVFRFAKRITLSKNPDWETLSDALLEITDEEITKVESFVISMVGERKKNDPEN